jgi:hypothetical protein
VGSPAGDVGRPAAWTEDGIRSRLASAATANERIVPSGLPMVALLGFLVVLTSLVGLKRAIGSSPPDLRNAVRWCIGRCAATSGETRVYYGGGSVGGGAAGGIVVLSEGVVVLASGGAVLLLDEFPD